MADLFGRAGTGGRAAPGIKITIKPDGPTEITYPDGVQLPPLIQSIAIHNKDMVAYATTSMPYPVHVDLSQVEDKVRAALGLKPEDPLRIATTYIAANGTGKDRLVVNGAEVIY